MVEYPEYKVQTAMSKKCMDMNSWQSEVVEVSALLATKKG
jgi:hypothetical protein